MPDTQIKDGCTIRPSFFYSNTGGARTPLLLLAYNAPKETSALAEKVGCRVLRIPPWDRLPAPVSSHPDMLVFPLPDGSLLMPADYYNAHADFWVKTGIPIKLTAHLFSDAYPNDVGLNQLVMDGCLFGRLDAAAREVRAAYPEQVAVRQGYARCSVLKLGEHAAITADRTLADALTKRGTDVLFIRAGYIRLTGYDYGFIGGASYELPDRTVCFFGSLSDHPDENAIRAFIEKHRFSLHVLSGELTDFGGGILLDPR